MRLLHALVDVIASNGWLIPALAAMEISQALVQAVLHTGTGEQSKLQASPLRQLPHFTVDLVKAANGKSFLKQGRSSTSMGAKHVRERAWHQRGRLSFGLVVQQWRSKMCLIS